VRSVRVSAPDGLEWDVRLYRVRLPPWRQVDLFGESPADGGQGDVLWLALDLVAMPLTLVLIPLLITLVELPVAVMRGLFSDTAWVEAISGYPTATRYLWQTTRADAPGVHAEVASALVAGRPLAPPRAELVERR
jgi:hypothetical protein